MFKKLFVLLLVTLMSLLVSADEWTHAEILLKSDEDITDQDLRDWLSSQKHIKKVYDDNVPTPRLQMYRKDKAEPAETLFIAHVPNSMVKEILSDKNLVKNKYDDDL